MAVEMGSEVALSWSTEETLEVDRMAVEMGLGVAPSWPAEKKGLLAQRNLALERVAGQTYPVQTGAGSWAGRV